MRIHSYVKHSRFRYHASSSTFTPPQLGKFYGFPAGMTGKGKKVAVIELGGDFSQSDLNVYFKSLGLTVAPVTAHLVDGGVRQSDPGGADVEVMLDLCVIGALAPDAALHCYFSPNTDAGFAAAISQAVADKMDAISISWGAPENEWSASSIAAFNAAFQAAAAAGITVTVAAGDNGSSDGESGKHVDFPASSPYVLGCGGTSIQSTSPVSEVVWNDGSQGGATGGGISSEFAIPSWQTKANVPGGKFRAVPDVAAVADPDTGYIIVANGEQIVVGGTSAVAPLMAALAVCVAQAIGKNVGFINPAIYGTVATFRDITSGNNGTYVAGAGYDCCTGIGVPVGSKLVQLFGASAPPAPPAPTPTPTAYPTLAQVQAAAASGSASALAAIYPKT